jgi:type IV pilus assembly protein PilA
MNRKFPLSRRKRARRSSLPDGFTLMELLIVMAIIVILLLMVSANVGLVMKKAHETSAIHSLKSITTAQIQYQSDYPSVGFACTLAALGGDPSSGPPSQAGLQMLPADLASGDKSGYIFTVKCSKSAINGTDRANGYEVTAVPEAVGKSGDRGFCSDQSGAIKFDPSGGTNCTQPLQ